LITLLSPIGGLLYPLISHLRARNQQKTLDLILHGVLNYLGLIALVGSLFLFVYSSHITGFLFGAEYWEAGNIVKWNLPFVFFGLISSLLVMVYAGMGLIKQRIKVLVGAVLANVVLNLAFSQIFGVYGIALATGLTRFFLFLFSYLDLRKSGVPLQLDYRLLAKNLIVGGMTLGVIYYFISIDISTKGTTIVGLLISGGLYAAVMALINIPIFKKARGLGQLLLKKTTDIDPDTSKN
ncbi:MAG: polysaccharide biosynthesis C-terminal domain-containing protein, partial [Candidatus Absconditabacterales bacterium]